MMHSYTGTPLYVACGRRVGTGQMQQKRTCEMDAHLEDHAFRLAGHGGLRLLCRRPALRWWLRGETCVGDKAPGGLTRGQTRAPMHGQERVVELFHS